MIPPDQESKVSSEEEQALLRNISFSAHTSINAAFAMLELLDDSTLSVEQNSIAAALRSSLLELMKSIRDITLFSQIKSGQTSAVSQFGLDQVSKKVVEAMSAKCEDKDIKFEFNCPKTKVTGFQLQLVQVFCNLVEGTAELCRPGGRIVINYSDGSFTLEASPLKKDFTSTSHHLLLAKKVLEACGGTINFESKNKLSFFLPVEASAEPVAAFPEGVKVLVAEDDLSTRETLVNWLSKLKANTQIAADGIQAIEVAKSSDFDIVLIDVDITELGGLEAAKVIKSKSNIPVVALTEHSKDRDPVKFNGSGLDGCIEKPLNRALVVSEILRCLESSS